MRALRARLKLAVAALGALMVLHGPADAQGSVVQSGPIVQFHPATWQQNGVVSDGGNASSPFLSAVGLFDGPSCPVSVSSQPGPGVSSTALSLLTLCQTSTAGTLAVAGLNGQANPTMFLNVGGVNVLALDPNAHMETGGSAPSCRVGCSAVAGTDSFFDVTGGSSVTSIAVNFAASWPTGVSAGGGPICSVTAENAAAVSGGVVSVATTTSAMTLTMGSETGARYQVHCGE